MENENNNQPTDSPRLDDSPCSVHVENLGRAGVGIVAASYERKLTAARELLVEARRYLDRMGQDGVISRIDDFLRQNVEVTQGCKPLSPPSCSSSGFLGGGNVGEDIVHSGASEVEEQPARDAGKVGTRGTLLTDREMAARAVSTFVIPVATLPFEKCAPILRKAFRNRTTTKLLLKLDGAVLKLGYFVLKVHELIIDCRHSIVFGVSFEEWRRRERCSLFQTNAEVSRTEGEKRS